MPIDVSKVRASAVDYLKYYDLEKYLFGDVRETYNRKDTIHPVDYYVILIWKANRAKNKTRDSLARTAGDFADAVKQITVDLHKCTGTEGRSESRRPVTR